MNRLCEKKCDCKQYGDANDLRSTLIKMELPECEDNQYGGTNYVVFRALRLIGYVVVLVLLGYTLWRVRVIESTLIASDRFANITRLVIESNNLHHNRVSRSIKENNLVERNSFGLDKGLPRGSMLTSKNEGLWPIKQKPLDKEGFEYLVNSLFDKIQMMHNDTDRTHFDKNMRAVFQAWFPVFDALLPRELMENEEVGKVESESSEDPLVEGKPRHKREITKSSEESSEEKSKHKREITKSSEESSEEKSKHKREITKSSEESSEEKKSKNEKEVTKSSEESSEEKKPKQKRSIQGSSEESVDEEENEADEDKSNSLESQVKVVENILESNENSSDISEKSSDSSQQKHRTSHP